MKSNYKIKILQWASAELFFTFSVISAVMFGIFSSSVSKSMGINTAELGWLSGVFFIVYAITQFYSGRLFVIFPTKYLLLASTLISAIGSMLFSSAHTIFFMFVARVLLGIGLASTFVGVLYVVQNNFEAKSFPLMSSLSQSIANLCAGIFSIFASLLIAKYDFRVPFACLALIFVLCAALVILFFKNKPRNCIKAVAPSISLQKGILILIKNPQVWLASLYFSGLFGAVLTFADLFNVSFQVEAFNISYSSAAILNSMIPFGLTIGGLVAGFISQRLNSYTIPSRILGLLSVLMFIIIMFIRFNDNSNILIMTIVCFAFGIGCSGSILAFQCIQKNVDDINLRPLATSFVLTFSYIFSGLFEQPVVGSLISSTVTKSIDPAKLVSLSHTWLFSPMIQDGWLKYDKGLAVILTTMIISFIASLFFKNK